MCTTRSLSASRASKQESRSKDKEEENYTNSSWLAGSRIGGRHSGGDWHDVHSS
jgi:hypothetical protein